MMCEMSVADKRKSALEIFSDKIYSLKNMLTAFDKTSAELNGIWGMFRIHFIVNLLNRYNIN